MLATCCGQLGKLILRTDFKTENLGLWCLITSSHSTWIVSFIVGQCHSSLHAFVPAVPLGLEDGLSSHGCQRQTHGLSTSSPSLRFQLNLQSLLQRPLSKTALSGKKTMGFEFGQIWRGQITYLSDRFFTIKCWVIVRLSDTKKMVDIITFIIPIIYLARALLSWMPKTWESDHILQHLYDLYNNSGVLAFSP